MRLLACALCLATFMAAGSAMAASADWRRDAAREDRSRIERLDGAWRTALREARAGHASEVAALGPLADPGAALERPQPGPGDYRCRTVKLGDRSGSGLAFVAYGWFRCRVELSPGGDLTLRKLSGSQRTAGHLYPLDDRRLAYLGAETWADEPAIAYRRNPERDQAGVFERIGPRRWRLVLPWPNYESKLDVLELVPAT